MTQSFTLTEDEVQLRVSLIDTPGFGTELDNTRCWVPLKAELEGRLKDYMNAEAKVERETSWPDLRVRCPRGWYLPREKHNLSLYCRIV